MSLIIAGQRKVSPKLAEKLCMNLDFDPQERGLILSEVKGENKPRATTKKATQLAHDQYTALSDWRAFALLSLIKTSDFQSDPEWIAERLGITKTEAKKTIHLLERLNMIEWNGEKLKRTKARYNSEDDVSNSALKLSHEETLALASDSLANDPVSERDFSWLTLAIDKKRLQEFKTLIHRFQDEVYQLASGQEKTSNEVYRLAVQLFPLSKSLKEKTNE